MESGALTQSRRQFLALSLLSLIGMRRHALASDRPVRIAAIDWTAAESLLALGVVPVAVSDTGYFRQRMPLVLPPDVTDIGPFWEINLELLEKIAPDLILAGSSTLVMTPAIMSIARIETIPDAVPSGDRYDLCVAILRAAASAAEIGLSRADAIVAQNDAHFSKHRQRLSRPSSRKAPRVCVMVPDQSGRGVVLYGKGSLPDAVLRRMGLNNAWQGTVNRAGIAQAGFETLFDIEDAVFMLVDIPSLRHQTVRALETSALWQALPTVRQGRTRWIGQFYPFGGCVSAMHLADAVAKVLESING